MSAIMEVRSRRKDSFKERHNISLGFMSFFTRAVVGALKAFPRLNAFGYWIYVFGGIFLYAGLLTNHNDSARTGALADRCRERSSRRSSAHCASSNGRTGSRPARTVAGRSSSSRSS